MAVAITHYKLYLMNITLDAASFMYMLSIPISSAVDTASQKKQIS
jgi:hypothetical protein